VSIRLRTVKVFALRYARSRAMRRRAMSTWTMATITLSPPSFGAIGLGRQTTSHTRKSGAAMDTQKRRDAAEEHATWRAEANG
jgi:hypothetical protein